MATPSAPEIREDGTVVVRDPRMIRAAAHPARITVLHHLYAGEVLTATDCARLAGITPSAMSYHLRALERYGLITRAEPRDDGRERPWRSVGTDIELDTSASHDARAAEGALMDSLVDLLRTNLTAAMADTSPGGAAGPAARRATGFTVVPALLTDEEARALTAEALALLERYAGRTDPSPDARHYHLYLAALPVDPREPASPRDESQNT